MSGRRCTASITPATDTAEDPHSPIVLGFWRVQLGNVGLYKRGGGRPASSCASTRRDIPSDNFDRYAFDHALLGLAIGISILVAVMWALGFGLVTGFLAAGIHAVLYVMLAGAINAVGHTFGSRPYANSATNLQPLAIIDRRRGPAQQPPCRAHLGALLVGRGEIDPGWWFVRILVALHLAQVRHEDVHLKSAA